MITSIHAGIFDIALLIVPAEDLSKSMPVGVGSYEMTRDRLKALPPLKVNFPFAILGISDTPVENIMVEELTSELDLFLINQIGFSLIEIQLQKERPQYDFKEQLPQNNRSTAKEICSFANLRGGGYLLFGINDDGNIIGIPRNEIDELQLRITQIALDNCTPRPHINHYVFDVPNNEEHCIVITKIDEMEDKPCMVQEKVFIRVETSARAAGPSEIRRLNLGRGA